MKIPINNRPKELAHTKIYKRLFLYVEKLHPPLGKTHIKTEK